MRIERSGPVSKLTPRLIRFLLEGLDGIALDDVQSAEEERIDYECLRGLLAIELKTLEGDPSLRTNNFVDGLRERSDFPTFFGSVPSEAAFANMENPEGLRREIINRVGRPIITHLKKANGQLAAHERRFPRRNRVRVMILVNEDHPEYHPEAVGWIISEAFRKKGQDNQPRFGQIDAVLYLTERHATQADDRIVIPSTVVLGPSSIEFPWKVQVLDDFVRRWAQWNNSPLITDEELGREFVAMEHISEKIPRHEAWRVDYRRQPHLRKISNEKLRDEFDEVMVLSTLFGLKHSPMKISMEQFGVVMERFTHIQVEMHERALPMEAFAHEAARELAAAKRLKLPVAVLKWLEEFSPNQ